MVNQSETVLITVINMSNFVASFSTPDGSRDIQIEATDVNQAFKEAMAKKEKGWKLVIVRPAS